MVILTPLLFILLIAAACWSGIVAGADIKGSKGQNAESVLPEVPQVNPQEPSVDPQEPSSEADNDLPTKEPPVAVKYPEATVKESKAVPDEYFKKAIFIGDSRTEGLALYSGIPGMRSYAGRGITVGNIKTERIMNRGGKKISIIDALKQDASFNQVYIMLGTNELGWQSTDMFVKKYEELIKEIKAIHPKATIYIQSILPVYEPDVKQGDHFNNQRIAEFNVLIKEMCEKNKVCYLDVASALADEKGSIPQGAAYDGIHLKKDGCLKWIEYLKTHTMK